MSVAEWLGSIAAALAILGVLWAVARWFYVRWRDSCPPEVTVATDVSLNRREFPADRYNTGWSRNLTKLYTIIVVRNMRGKPLVLSGVKLEFAELDYPVWIQATNSPRELEHKEPTHFYFENDKYPSAVPSAITIRWTGGEHVYRSLPQARGWTASVPVAH